jgi:hypothetical protein
MKEEGVSDQLISSIIRYEPGCSEHHIKETLKLIINPKTGKFWGYSDITECRKVIRRRDRRYKNGT